MRIIRPLTLTASLVVIALLGTGLRAQPPAAPTAPAGGAAPLPGEITVRLSRPSQELAVTALQSRVLVTEGRIRLVDDFDPQIISITALSPNQLRLRGEAPGITTIRISDEFDNVFRVEVMVEKDLRELEANLRRLFPGSSINVVAVKDDIVLQGWVTQPSQIPQIVDLARTYAPNIQNHMQVGGGNQVQLQVKVLEVQRSKMEQLGFNFLVLGQSGYFASSPGALAPIAETTLPFGGPPTIATQAAALANPTAQFAILSSTDIFRGFIDALKQESLLKIVAEPTLITTSGRPAEFHSGGEFPILVPQGVGTATIEFRPFGVRLEAVPIVLGNGRVQMDIGAEISERDFSNSVVAGGVTVPGLTSRDVNTRVEMNFGETVMLGGLTQDRVVSSTNKVPVLGDIPYLGIAFSRKNHTVSTTELIILVTPYLTAPLPNGQAPMNGPGLNSGDPTSHEYFVDAHIEVPRFGGGEFCPPGMMPIEARAPQAGPGYGTYRGPIDAAPYNAEQNYSPGFEYVPGGPSNGLQPQPNFPSGDGLSPLPAPGADAGTSSSFIAPTTFRNAGVPAVGGDYRFNSRVQPASAESADAAAQRGVLPNRPSPGLIEPGRGTSRSAPQYVGSSGITR